jgi:hypothetical protein
VDRRTGFARRVEERATNGAVADEVARTAIEHQVDHRGRALALAWSAETG